MRSLPTASGTLRSPAFPTETLRWPGCRTSRMGAAGGFMAARWGRRSRRLRRCRSVRPGSPRTSRSERSSERFRSTASSARALRSPSWTTPADASRCWHRTSFSPRCSTTRPPRAIRSSSGPPPAPEFSTRPSSFRSATFPTRPPARRSSWCRGPSFGQTATPRTTSRTPLSPLSREAVSS